MSARPGPSGPLGRAQLGALALFIGTLAGCGHRGGGAASGSTAGGGETQSIAGVWNGADSAGRSIIGLVDEAGEFHLIREDGTQYAGTATITGDTVSASAERVVSAGSPEGAKADAVVLKGTVRQGESMSLTVEAGASTRAFAPETLSLQFNPIYDQASSLAMFAGDYRDNSSGNTLTVTGGGAFFWRDARSGCLASGAVSVIDAHHDLYEVQFSYSACQGVAAALNGVQFSGLGTLDTSVQPTQAMIGVTGEAAGRSHAIELKLSRLPPRSPV